MLRVILVLLLLPACGGRRPSEEMAGEVVKKFIHAIDYADLEQLMTTMSEDCRMWYPWKAEPAKNREAIEQEFRSLWEGRREPGKGPYFNIAISSMEIRPIVEGVVGVTFYTTTAQDVLGRRTAILRDDKGSWKIVLFHGDNFERPS